MKTFLFGAGASIPYFSPRLDTAYLTKQVCSVHNWERVMEKYREHNGKNRLMTDADTVSHLISAIRDICPNSNFEQIAEILDKICSWGFDKLPCSNMLNLLLTTMNTGFLPQKNNPFGCEWNDIPFLFREIVAEAILDLEENHKSESFHSLINLQRDFIGAVCDKDDEVSVVSLNYDDCILDSLSGLGFEKGFRPTNAYYRRQLDIGLFMHAKRVVYFPHGHIRFQFTDNDNVTFFADSKTANQERWENIDGSGKGSTVTVLPGKFSYNYNTFISTGQTKDDGLNHLPYAVYFQRLAIDLFKSNAVYIIGYSFGDDHFNRLLKSFIQNNPNNKVFIIDYHPAGIDMANIQNGENEIVKKIHYCFNTEWVLTYSDEKGLMPDKPEKIDQINQLGHGWLFPQVYFYKKGYEDFLHDYQYLLDRMV